MSLEHLEDTVSEQFLNESQSEAVKRSLAHKLSLIQGPPGTGKVYARLFTRLTDRFTFSKSDDDNCQPFQNMEAKTETTWVFPLIFGLAAVLTEFALRPALAAAASNVAVDQLALGLLRFTDGEGRRSKSHHERFFMYRKNLQIHRCENRIQSFETCPCWEAGSGQ